MGCDINVLIQLFEFNQWVLVQRTVRDKSNPNNKHDLQSITSEEYNRLCKEHEKCKEYEYECEYDDCNNENCYHFNNDCECFGDFRIHFGTRRDYRFFSKIANVRSYYEDIIPIEAKGVPEDLDDIIRKIIIDDDDEKMYKYLSPLDFHSHTYFYDYEVDEIELENSIGMENFKDLLKMVRSNFVNMKSRFLICFDN